MKSQAPQLAITSAMSSCRSSGRTLSPARISQLREWLRKSWEAFQGEAVIGGRPQPAVA
jgi:hypothetical protein